MSQDSECKFDQSRRITGQDPGICVVVQYLIQPAGVCDEYQSPARTPVKYVATALLQGLSSRSPEFIDQNKLEVQSLI